VPVIFIIAAPIAISCSGRRLRLLDGGNHTALKVNLTVRWRWRSKAIARAMKLRKIVLNSGSWSDSLCRIISVRRLLRTGNVFKELDSSVLQSVLLNSLFDSSVLESVLLNSLFDNLKPVRK
jgi:hypothetical protein